jgi:uncharacterized protein YbaR (Trm112 family)
MEYNLIEFIICPMCKSNSFSLTVMSPGNSYHKSQHAVENKTDNNDKVENGIMDIIDGVLLCNSCGRWYPISNNIYILLPDILRDSRESIEFLKKYKTMLPEVIVNNGKPFNLRGI